MNIQRTSSASGKIILSGEYAVVFGYPGIAIPSERRVHISFIQSQKKGASTIVWNDETANDHWREYAKKIADLIEKKTGMHGTYEIKNNIPLGRGMGSSTALVIAITKVALGDYCEQIARDIEDAVNPGNSGLDFTVIWHEKPVLFKRGSKPAFIALPKDLIAGMSLIDTGTPNETTPELVAWVKSRYECHAREASRPLVSGKNSTHGSGYLPAIDDQEKVHGAIETIGHCTDRILKGEPLKDIIKDHHRAQVALGVVPETVQKLIAEIESGGGSAKVLGAGGRTGGGGMILKIV